MERSEEELSVTRCQFLAARSLGKLNSQIPGELKEEPLPELATDG
jgi:hypothetical protein